MKTGRLHGILLLLVLAFLTAGCSRKAEVLKDGSYLMDIETEGGKGKARVISPASMKVNGGKIKIKLVWSSPNFDYVIVDGTKYLNETPGGNSTFTVPVDNIGEPLLIVADTTAMSVPHEIEYTLAFGDYREEGGFDSLEKTGSLKLEYAGQFSVDYYGNYSLVTIYDGGISADRTKVSQKFLIVEEDDEVPSGVPSDITVLKKPLYKTYLISTPVMDMVDTIGAMDFIKYCGTRQKDWYIDCAIKALEDGSLIYAGKYNAPDYELLTSIGCSLSIQNTMIYHNPEVKEKLEALGIPVLVERSAYEEEPMGRLEWIKLYGLLYGKEEEASSYFEKMDEMIKPLIKEEKSGLTAAFFYITSNGAVNVRKGSDYISRMINMAGLEYFLDDVEDGSALSTINMTMEDFYEAARDCDILIYNTIVDKNLKSYGELLEKSPMFADFKAVKNNRVYRTGSHFYQATTSLPLFLSDVSKASRDEEDGMFFLTKLAK